MGIKDYRPDDLIQAAHKANEAALESVTPIWKADMLKDNSKNVLAFLMTKIRATRTDKVSETELERIARASKEWEQFQEGQFQAQKAGLEAKVKMQNAQRDFDALQSALSFRREEMKRLGGQV